MRPNANGSNLGFAAPRTEEKPEYQAQNGQQYYRDDPEQFLLIRYGTLENVDNRPDIPNEYQQTQEAVVSHIVHHGFAPD
jgi:hypothetical protein